MLTLGLVGGLSLLVGIVLGLALRGCLVLGNRRTLDLQVQRLVAETRIDLATRRSLAALRQVARDHFRR